MYAFGTLIQTFELADESVTFPKIQDVATDRLAGRDTAGTGSLEQLTVTGGVEFTGAGGIQRSALTGDVTASAGSNATTIANDAVSFAKMQNLATDRLVGRDTAATGDPEEIAVAGGLEFSGSQSIQRSALTGDVTAAAGSNATTIAADAVDNTKLANMAAALVKGRAEGAGIGDPQDLTAAQVKAILDYLASEVAYSNATSGMTADDVQEALDELDARLDALANGMVFQGSVDAGGGAGPVNFPGAGAAQAGWFYTVINANANGTIFGSSNPITVHTGDALVADTDNASATDGADWFKLDNTDAVTSVAGKVGTVVLETGDITNVTQARFLGRADGAGTGVAQQLTAAQAKAILGQFLTADIADNQITFAKLQDIATDRLIGRDTAATGDPEEIAVTGGLEFSGSQSIQRSALTGDVTAAAGSNATTVANDAISFAKMQNLTTDRLIGRDTTGTGDPEEIAVSGGLEFSGSAAIQRSALTGDVTASAGSNATTIANDAVTNAKAADMAQSTIKGRAEGAGTGDPTDLSIAQVKAILDYLLADITTNAQYSFGLFTMGFSRKDNTSSSGSVTIDLGTSNKQRLTLDEDVTTLAFTAPTNPCSIILQVIQDSTGGWTIDWADVTNLKWPGGTEVQPTADPDAVDLYSIYWDGTNFHIAAVPDFLVP